MAKTVPGGAYLSADSKTWHDANGNVIPSPMPVVQPVADEIKGDSEPLAPAPEPEKVKTPPRGDKPKGDKPK